MRLERTVIGMVHLPPLPGSPRWDGSMAKVVAAALADAGALVEGGVDAVLVENFNDMPFTPGRVEPATVAAMSVVAAEVRRALPRTPLGLNVLKNDARAALLPALMSGTSVATVSGGTARSNGSHAMPSRESAARTAMRRYHSGMSGSDSSAPGAGS